MFNTEQDERKMALAITHYAYRNTALEDFHSENVQMNKAFYKRIYKIVYYKLKNVCKFHKYIKNCDFELKVKDDYEMLLNTVPEEDRFKFAEYFLAILTTIEFRYGSRWNPAEVIDCDLRGKSPASYVLSGRFSECCEKGEFLDDKTMCYVNQDVHNRIYTLLVNGYFN